MTHPYAHELMRMEFLSDWDSHLHEIQWGLLVLLPFESKVPDLVLVGSWTKYIDIAHTN